MSLLHPNSRFEDRSCPLLCLKIPRGETDRSPAALETEKPDLSGSTEPTLVCVACHHNITSAKYRIEKAGSHQHTFANPSGMIFRIGCFQYAPGCLAAEEGIADFTWFVGFMWSFAGCSMCGNHLGWLYKAGEETFYGLILDQLIEKEQKAN